MLVSFANGCCDCWSSAESLRIYARINDFRYTEWLENAGLAAVSSVRTTTAALNAESAAAVAVASTSAAAGTPEVGAAHAAFQSDYRARAAEVAEAKLLEGASKRPVVDGDGQAIAFASAMPALLREAERIDAEDGGA